MKPLLTAAMERALAEAAAWSSGHPTAALEAPALLIGLLAQSECRAAITLARHEVDLAAIRARWPDLKRLQPSDTVSPEPIVAEPRSSLAGASGLRLSEEVQQSFAEVYRRLRAFPQPLELATQHVLLGLAASDHEVGRWLRQKGVDPDRIEAEIRELYGFADEPAELGLPDALEIPAESLTETNAVATGRPGVPLDRVGASPQRPRPIDPPLVDTCARPHASEPPLAPEPTAMPQRLGALRVIDAAANRAGEGLRVVEDYVRFVLDDRFLTTALKEFRHQFSAWLSRFAWSDRLAARETQADVGTQLTACAERPRQNPTDLLAANFLRVEEALRSLEEFAKLLDPEAAAGFEQLRYRAYTLQRAVQTTQASLERLGHARLYVLVDGRASLEEFRALVQAVISGGAEAIQLREKHLEDRRLLERARLLRAMTSEANVLFIINDRPDLAALARADGVHLGQEELSVKDARAIVGPEALVGVSTHSIEQARQAVLDGANYLGVGPTFPSGTKHFDEFPGVELLRAVAAEIRLPAFAIGGIGPGNLAQVLETGIRRIAVCSAITTAADPLAATRLLRAGLRAQEAFPDS